MPTLFPDCQAIADEIKLLQAQLQELSAELQQVPTNQKTYIKNQILSLNKTIATKRKAFNQCMAMHPLPAPLTSTLTGSANLTLDPPSSGATTQISLKMTFSGYNYADVELNLPNISFHNVLLLTRNRITFLVDVVLALPENPDGSQYVPRGGYDITTHKIVIPLWFSLYPTYASPSWASWFYNTFYPLEKSDVVLDAPGLTGHISNVDKVSLQGAGTAKGGDLNNKRCVFGIFGTLQPVPG